MALVVVERLRRGGVGPHAPQGLAQIPARQVVGEPHLAPPSAQLHGPDDAMPSVIGPCALYPLARRAEVGFHVLQDGEGGFPLTAGVASVGSVKRHRLVLLPGASPAAPAAPAAARRGVVLWLSMVTETKAAAEPVKEADATGDESSVLENAEAEAFALLAAGDYEKGLAACEDVIHLAGESDTPCLERLIKRLAQIILQLTEEFNEIKPDAEMVRQSFSTVGLMTFARDGKTSLRAAALILHEDAERLLYLLRKENDNTGMPDKLPDLETSLQHVARNLGRPVATVRAQLGIDEATHETTDRATAEPGAEPPTKTLSPGALANREIAGRGTPKRQAKVNDLNSKLARLEAKAVKLRDGTLLSLIARYKMERNVALPPNGVPITDAELAKAAGRLPSTFKNLQGRLIEHGLKPLPPDERVLKAQRQSVAFYRHRKAATEPV